MSTNEPPAEQPPSDTPPPPGGYGAPPPAGGYGGYGGYGAPPPYPAPQGPAAGYSLGDALSYGWSKFSANAGQIILAAVVLLLGLGIVAGIGYAVIGGITSQDCTTDPQTFRTTCTGGTSFALGLVLQALLSSVLVVVAQVIGAGMVRGALGITEGRRFQFSDLLRVDRIGAVLVAGLIIAVATFIGTLMCYLPGLVVGFATSYTLYFLLDKDMAPVEAITASVTFVKDNLANTLVWYIVGGLIAAAGVLVCFVGALVSVPVVLIGTAFTYKRLTGQPVAA